MPLPKRLPDNRNIRLYLMGQLAIIGGALAMDVWHSMLPMALAASLALMLTVPIVRQHAMRRSKG